MTYPDMMPPDSGPPDPVPTVPGPIKPPPVGEPIPPGTPKPQPLIAEPVRLGKGDTLPLTAWQTPPKTVAVPDSTPAQVPETSNTEARKTSEHGLDIPQKEKP